MPFFHHPIPAHRLLLFPPPYNRTIPIDLSWRPDRFLAGHAVVWYMQDVPEHRHEFDWLYDRPPELSLIIVLPSPSHISEIAESVEYLPILRPIGVLPLGNTNSPKYYRDLLLLRNDRVATKVSDHLRYRGLIEDRYTLDRVRAILHHSTEMNSVSRLAMQMRISRRTLGRRFQAAEIPPPSSWLQFGRLLHVCLKLQSGTKTVFEIATAFQYSDGFTVSNQMRRLIGYRPSDVRHLRGWEWIVEAWLRGQAGAGYFSRYQDGEFDHNH